MTDLYLTEIELKRVQSFLFEVPRLKAMLGANALIGAVLRHSLPELAVRMGACNIATSGQTFPCDDDPLPVKGGGTSRIPTGDDPLALHRLGILVRDGGRFMAAFDDEGKAQEFRAAAGALITEHLPGMRYEADVRRVGEGPRQTVDDTAAREVQLLDLPVLQVCQETGQGVASGTVPGKGTLASAAALARYDAGDAFYRGTSRDLVGLLREPLGLTSDSGWQDPHDLDELCAGGYLALIHADGNGVGRRYKDHLARYADGGDPLAREIWGERFFHSMRCAVRKALVAALSDTFARMGGVRPYQVLMLGGDDLLIACRADRALEFALNYAERLGQYSLADGRPLDVGIGIAITRHTYPLHRLHELAESLAASAKRRYRAQPDIGSVIDWQVVTQSWFDDVAQSRRRADLRRYRVDGVEETLVLTARPYPIFTENDGICLCDLLCAAQRLDAGETQTAPRSPLRGLRPAFEAGRLAAETAFARLDPGVRRILAGGNGDGPWLQRADRHYLTRVLDIVGLREIARLGRKKHD